MAKYHTLTLERVRELVDYDPTTGEFRWKVTRPGIAPVGGIAGTDNGKGYRRLCLDGCPVKAHILAWFVTHGTWPTDQIDHRNGEKADNRLSNLREATAQQNKQNMRRANANNRSGFLGVSRSGHRWQAIIHIDAKQTHLGYYETAELASAAYNEAKCRLHPFATT